MIDQTFVALDLETTGLPPRLDRIIEIGAVRFRGCEVLGRFDTLVHPGVPIPVSVQQLTGITDADVRGAAPPEDALVELREFVGDAWVVAHSGGFDLSFLGTGRSYELFDTLDLARILLPTAPSHSLPHLSRQLGLSHRHPHRAASDAEAARQLFNHLWTVARSLPLEVQERMLDITLGWTHPLRRFLEEVREAGPAAVGPAPTPAPTAAASEPTGVPRADPSAMAELLDPTGPLAAHLPDYELRESQRQMAVAIAQLFQRGGRLMVEAGPGTGKSMAYLLPALHHAAAAQERVVVATNTITLQEQLFSQEIPFLKRSLPFGFKPALLKGRANYVSLRRWNRYLNAPSRKADGSWFTEEVKFKLRMLVWLAHSPLGDRSEIRLSGLDEWFWTRAQSTPDDCLAAHCENYQSQRCFYWNSRRAAQDADLVVTNHALLLADALAGGTVLPPYRHLVVDEAHQLEEAAVESLIVGLSEAELIETLSAALTWFASATGRRDQSVEDAARAATESIAAFFQGVSVEVRPPTAAMDAAPVNAVRPEEAFIIDPERRESAGIGQLARRASALAGMLASLCDGFESAVAAQESSHAMRELEHWSARLRAQAELLDEAMVAPRKDRLYWFELERRSGRPVLRAAPTDAGPTLRERVLAEKETVVFTSATLSLGESFGYFRRGVGLSDASAHELILPSPFDYLSQALLCLPVDLKDLGDPGFLDQVAEVVAGIGRTLRGRTLVLFTAHQQLREVAGRLRVLTAHDGLTVAAQNIDGTRRQLLQQFKEQPNTVLLGTDSFWEGIDVPGDALSCVVIVRLPFRVPTDPIQLARAAGLQDSFRELALPEAVLRLKQGFGRLIRKQTDRGAAVILDHRLANRAYGRAFLDALPRAAVVVGRTAELPHRIQEWLQQAPGRG